MTWDGPKVNYLETLFIPIFKALQDSYGYQFHVVQFIWGGSEIIGQRQQRFSELGIPYQAFKISNKYPVFSLLKALLLDTFKIKQYIRKHGIEVIMPRATTSMAIVNQLANKSKLVFDADGFSQDERVDFNGLSKDSFRYKLYRQIERKGFRKAMAILCRSEKAKQIIAERAGAGFELEKVFVERNGTFVPKTELTPKKDGICKLVYSGSVGPQYRIAEVFSLYKIIKEEIPDATLSVLTVQVGAALDLLKDTFQDLIEDIEIRSVSPDMIHEELSKYHIGISLRKTAFSTQAVAPIKVGEYLSAGLSVVFSPGTGDLDALFKGKPFAYSFLGLENTDPKKLQQWSKEQITEDYAQEILKMAKQYFSLEETVKIYHNALQYG